MDLIYQFSASLSQLTEIAPDSGAASAAACRLRYRRPAMLAKAAIRIATQTPGMMTDAESGLGREDLSASLR
jgi:hypothetical protein